MTIKEALNIVETYNYWKGGADEIGNVCINPNYLKAKKSYGEAKSIIEKQDKVLDIYELIKQKKENAENDRIRCEREVYLKNKYDNITKLPKLSGEIEAYTDVLCLIESSGVLNDK